MAFRCASRVARLHFSRASRKNGDGQLDQIVVIAFGGEIIEDDVLVEVIVKLQMMFLCVGEQLETVRVNIFIAMRVVEHQKSAAAAQRDLFTVNIRQLRRMHIGVEFRVLIAVRGDRITRNRGADGVSAVKTERLTKSKRSLTKALTNIAKDCAQCMFRAEQATSKFCLSVTTSAVSSPAHK